jgi:hypothetical protein
MLFSFYGLYLRCIFMIKDIYYCDLDTGCIVCLLLNWYALHSVVWMQIWLGLRLQYNTTVNDLCFVYLRLEILSFFCVFLTNRRIMCYALILFLNLSCMFSNFYCYFVSELIPTENFIDSFYFLTSIIQELFCLVKRFSVFFYYI